MLFVYDLVDTEGRDLPEQWQNPFQARGRLDQVLWQTTLDNCRRQGIYVNSHANYSFLHAGTAFRLRSSNRLLKEYPTEPFDFLVEVSKDQDLPTQYATLAHELGHIFSGHLGAREGDDWADRRRLTHGQVEVEAESISYLICRRRGIATKSEQYLARFADENCQMPEISLETILKVTYRVERMAEQDLPARRHSKVDSFAPAV